MSFNIELTEEEIQRYREAIQSFSDEELDSKITEFSKVVDKTEKEIDELPEPERFFERMRFINEIIVIYDLFIDELKCRRDKAKQEMEVN